VPSTGKLSNSVAIVTAAGAGIGEAIAKMFAREGAAVALVDINADDLRRVETEIVGAGGRVHALRVDVTRSQDVSAMVQEVVKRFGTVDILINAAGGFHRLAPITDISDEEWNRVIDLNLKSAFYCSRAVAPIMIVPSGLRRSCETTDRISSRARVASSASRCASRSMR